MKMEDKRNSLTRHSSRRYKRRSRSAINNIAIHHSATTSGSAESFASYHVNSLGWPGIGYHYVVDRNGTISRCHDLEVVSYHVGNSNSRAVGICMVGDFRTQNPTDTQLEATISLTNYLLNELNLSIQNVWGHNEFPSYASTICPAINMNTFRNNLSRVKGVSTDQPVQSPSYVNGSTNRTYLTRGDQGDDVKEIQEKLNELGFNAGTADGIFGTQTYRALTSFQRHARIGVDGIVGPETREALKKSNEITETVDHSSPLDESDENVERFEGESRRMLRYIQPMMRGQDVVEVQQKVGAIADGIFGPSTEQRVREFQQRNNLIVDGIVGPQTQKALDRINNSGQQPIYRRLLSLQTPFIQGEDVKHVQRRLGISVDGLYGPVTERAVRNFQRREGISSDGIVGPQTWRRLFE